MLNTILTTNHMKITVVILILFCLLLIGIILYDKYKKDNVVVVEEELTEEQLEPIREWRSYFVNKTLTALIHGFKINENLEECKRYFVVHSPKVNEIVAHFAYDACRITVHFDWNSGYLTAEALVPIDDNKTKRKQIRLLLTNAGVDDVRLMKFINDVYDLYTDYYNLTATDVHEAAMFLAESEDAQQDEVMFESALNLFLLLQNKKLRRNHSLMTAYLQLMSYILANKKEEFMNYCKPNNSKNEK